MAYLNFDDKLVTWTKYFDEDNSKMVDALNRIEEAYKSKAQDQTRMVTPFKELWLLYKDWIAKIKKEMHTHKYENHDAFLRMLTLHINFLSSTYRSVSSVNSRWLTDKLLEQIKESVTTIIKCERQFVTYLKTKYHDKINEILAKDE